MPLNDQDIRALTYLAGRCRPLGAPRWDEAGIFAAITKVRHLAMDDVALSVIRAAADAKAQTPGVISNTRAPNWQERAVSRSQPFEPLKPSERCSICNQPRHRCERLAAVGPDGHTFTPDLPPADPETGELIERPDTTDRRALVRAAIRRSETE